MRPQASAPAASLRSARFRAEREAGWRRLERLIDRAERKGPAALSDDELLAIPGLYRSTLSALSVARTISLDSALITYLEALSARAYFYVYGVRSRPGERIASFFRKDWPLAAQRLLLDTFIAGAAMLAAAIAAFLMVLGDPDWYYAFVPEALAGGRTPAASVEFLRSTLFDAGESYGLSTFAASLFTHNSSVAILAFALGFALGLPSILLMAYNGFTLGAFVALFAMKGLAVDALGWLLIHGVTELLAVTLAGAAGLHIGRAIAFPGGLSRLEAASRAGRDAAALLVGVLLMLLIAGVIEGVGRQVITSTPTRFAIAAVSGMVWIFYLYWPRDRGGSR